MKFKVTCKFCKKIKIIEAIDQPNAEYIFGMIHVKECKMFQCRVAEAIQLANQVFRRYFEVEPYVT